MDFRIARLAHHIGLVAIVALGLLAGCGGASGGPENVFIADENDNGQRVTMSTGDALQITLPENRSTGYVWSVVTNDEEVLRPTDDPAYEIEGEPLPGDGGRVTLYFEAAGPGSVTLRLINARPQETAVEPVATFELTVEVAAP